jgi:hypothetical protein
MLRLTLDAFRRRFDEIVTETNPTWEAIGFLTPENVVYPIGTDSKVLSTIFESLAWPLVVEIAEQFEYIVEGSPQTIYPDFTLTPQSRRPPRIAIDIKTTYRSFAPNGQILPFRYTLGSYTSFLRSPGATKNIKYPYSEYGAHWVIGFLYTRKSNVAAKVYHRDEVNRSLCPYEDVEYFIQHKYKIAGLTPGSGNTANIGSFPTNDIQDLRNGVGPFARFGKDACDDYWRNFSRDSVSRPYSTIEEFFAWKRGRRR